jgi:hypothetical protein
MSAERASWYLETNWPSDLAWPAGIRRLGNCAVEPLPPRPLELPLLEVAEAS